MGLDGHFSLQDGLQLAFRNETFDVVRLKRIAQSARLPNIRLFTYNPVVGWWFLPFGKSITRHLELNTPKWHGKKARLGHVITLLTRKP